MTPNNATDGAPNDAEGHRPVLTVTDEDNGLRLDQFITKALLRLEGEAALESPPSRSRVRVLLEEKSTAHCRELWTLHTFPARVL